MTHPDFANALRRELGAPAPPSAADAADPHPDLETWAAYGAGDLDAETEESLREHLLRCRECLALVSELHELEHAEEEAEGADADEVAAVLAGVRSRLAAEGEAVPGPAALRRPSRPRWALRLAASVTLLALVALAGWALHLRERVDGLEERLAAATRPSGVVPILDLHAPTVRRQPGAEAEVAPVSVPADAGYVTWVLHLPPGADADAFRVDLLDAGGHRLWRGEGLRPDPRYHTLTLGTPGDFLRPGRYLVRVTAAGEPVADYPVRIEAP